LTLNDVCMTILDDETQNKQSLQMAQNLYCRTP
jgi:hypothetical protein